MCGIFGELKGSEGVAGTEAFERAAAQALAHRGPDGNGTWRDRRCLLGHTRLAIIDLSTGASQPMTSASGETHVAFNGEIYNYLELRARSTPPTHGWRSASDTEVLVEMLDCTGLDAVRSWLGMFSVAAWQPRRGELWLIRDRLGKKPLYWARTREGGLRFASELGALLVDGAVPRETTPDRLAEFLQHGYVAAPRTGLCGVSVVPAGCWLRARVTPSGVETTLERYWAPPKPGRLDADRGAWLEEFEATLRDAVRIRLRSDVPLGAFLSGGVDSSVVSLLASELGTGRLRTFTVDFEHDQWSEGKFGAEVAARLGTEHTVLRVDASCAARVDEIVAVYGDLHGDSSAIPTLALCRETRRHVTVALSGDGGDEMLGGYGRYARAVDAVARAARWPAYALRAARWIGARMPWCARGSARLGRWSAELDAYYASGFLAYAPHPWPPVLDPRLRGDWPDGVTAALLAERERSPLQRLMACDVATYLPEDILVKMDRASMAVGLEVRSPLLDHRLCELAMRADPRWLTDGAATKLPLRALYKGRLPGTVFGRQKMGFGVPLQHWLRGDLDAMARDRLLRASGASAGVLHRGAVRRLLASHRSGQRDESGRIWRLLVLDAWLERWRPRIVAERDSVEPASESPGRAA
jgi:asparagine synthase (glutamine-hydrolysing)